MSEKTRLCRRARNRLPLLALTTLLSPSFSSAAPPVDEPRETSPIAVSSDGLPRAQARKGNTRIGRIFFSPAERRHRNANKTPVSEAPNTGHPARGERLEINGAVSSSTQGRAVWVNGAAIENSAKFKPAWTDREGNVWLRNDRGTSRLVRPGQALDPASGAIEDLLPAGSAARR